MFANEFQADLTKCKYVPRPISTVEPLVNRTCCVRFNHVFWPRPWVVNTMCNVCSIHERRISWVRRGIPWVDYRMLSTLGGHHDSYGEISWLTWKIPWLMWKNPWVGRYSLHRGIPYWGMLSTLGGYHAILGITWVHWRMFSTSGDTMMHVGNIVLHLGGSFHIGPCRMCFISRVAFFSELVRRICQIFLSWVGYCSG